MSGYRDFDVLEENKNLYENIAFTVDLDDFKEQLKVLECFGGRDRPDDMNGGL